MTIAAGFRLEGYRNYLIALARVKLVTAGPVRNKIDASDLVQDVVVKAHEARRQFNGTTAEEYAAWLRRILANKLADAQRRYGRQKRDAALEKTIRVGIDESASRIDRIAADQTSPSQHVARQETALLLAEALTALPEDQRTAVELRHIEDLPLADIAALMSRTQPAVAGLLRRGLGNLRQRLAPLA